jgi:hypothetical protein
MNKNIYKSKVRGTIVVNSEVTTLRKIILEGFGSNPGRDTSYPKVFFVTFLVL